MTDQNDSRLKGTGWPLIAALLTIGVLTGEERATPQGYAESAEMVVKQYRAVLKELERTA